jgi:hypothetical protein
MSRQDTWRSLLAAVLLSWCVVGSADTAGVNGSLFDYLKTTPASLMDLGLTKANTELSDQGSCVRGRRDFGACTPKSVAAQISFAVEHVTGRALTRIDVGMDRPEMTGGEALRLWVQLDAPQPLPNNDACRLALSTAWQHVEIRWGLWFLPKTMDGHLMADQALPDLHERFSEEMTFACYCRDNNNISRKCGVSSNDHRAVESWEDQVLEKYRSKP